MTQATFKSLAIGAETLLDWVKRAYVSIACNQKVRRLQKTSNGHPNAITPPNGWTSALEAEARTFLGSLSSGYTNLRWHKLYASINSQFSPYYIPEDLYYSAIEPKLNPPSRITKYSDKNFFDSLGFGPAPKTLARVLRGRLLDANLNPISLSQLKVPSHAEFVLKPASHTGQGRGIQFLQGKALNQQLELILGHPDADYILQECISQADSTKRLNPSSLNTLRILTFRSPVGITPLSTVVRFGRAASRLDNYTIGGLACGVRQGKLQPFAVDRHARTHTRHPDTGLEFCDLTVPEHGVALQKAIELHSLIPDLDLVSWDFAIQNSGDPIFIEHNLKYQEINFHQLCNGPIFLAAIPTLKTMARSRTLFGLPL